MGGKFSMFSDNDEPYNVRALNREYQNCLGEANCNRLSYFNKRKCKRECRALIDKRNNDLDVEEDECDKLGTRAQRANCKSRWQEKNNRDNIAKILEKEYPPPSHKFAELGGKRKTPKKSKFKVSRVYRSTRKIRQLK
jgi:hypothetical protein